MKITAIALLLASTSAVKLHQRNAMKKHITELRCPTPAEEAELAAAAEAELARDGSISKDDVLAYMKSKGVTASDEVLAEAEAIFDAVDTSGDGALQLEELQAAEAEYRKHCPAAF